MLFGPCNLFSAFDLFVHMICFSMTFGGLEVVMFMGMNAAVR